MANLAVSQHVLQQTEFGGTQATAAAVHLLQLEFPSLSRPVTLRVRGVRLALQQVRLPKVSLAAVKLASRAACTFQLAALAE